MTSPPVWLSTAFAALFAVGCGPARQSVAVVSGATEVISRETGEGPQVYRDLVYLASDALAGRRAGTPGNEAAAEYIVAALREAGAVPVGEGASMRVPVPLLRRGVVEEASMSFGESRLRIGTDVVPLSYRSADVTAPLLYVPPEALADVGEEVVGTMVVTEAGDDSTAGDLRGMLDLSAARNERLANVGAVALVEVYRSPAVPFPRLQGGLNKAGFVLGGGARTQVPATYVKAGPVWDALRRGRSAGTAATLRLVAPDVEEVVSHNVAATLPGTDPALAGEYVAVTAHFDHIGVTPRPGAADSINNGARDNGMGTVALLEVARRFRENPGRRPLLLMAWTAEEEGLLGSAYWAEHPTVPLDQVAFNFNMDGAGYTDTTAVVFNGYDFTTVQGVMDAAVAKTGLTARPDPVPQYGLYGASDNVNLARAGVPAVNMAPGFEGFTDELMRYYHQPADEAAAVSPTYLQKYADAAVAAVRAVADADDVSWNLRSEALREFVDLD